MARHHAGEHVVHPLHLPCEIAERPGRRARRARVARAGLVHQQSAQCGRERVDIVRRDEHAAGVVDDLQGAAERGRHDRQARGLRLDERDAERFGLVLGWQ